MRYTDGNEILTQRELQNKLNVSFPWGSPPSPWTTYAEPVSAPYVPTWADIREIRAEKLKECDWTQTLDVVLTSAEKLVWAEYRQALRDIPQNFANPEDVIYPEKP